MHHVIDNFNDGTRTMFKENDDNSIQFDDFLGCFPASGWLSRKIRQYEICDDQALLNKLYKDMQWIADNDPAAKNNIKYVDSCYTSALALACYRLSNYLHMNHGLIHDAECITNEIYKITRIYIHPNSKLGCPISIDHGYKTFIGTSCEIGDRCIILNGVQVSNLKAKGPAGSHEPCKIKIGSDVVICANVIILGGQHIKDGAFLKPFSSLKGVNDKVLMA